MNAFSSAADGWCSLQSSRPSSTTRPSATSALAWVYPGLWSLTVIVSPPSSNAPRIGVGKLARLPPARALQRLERMRLVDVYDGVELVGDPRVEVVRDALGLGAGDDADRALKPAAPGARGVEAETPA